MRAPVLRAAPFFAFESPAPADTPKTGTAFDLPIALAFLVATGQLDAAAVAARMFVGELGLDGSLRPVRGALPVARHAAARRVAALVVPPANVAEAALVRAAPLAAPASLAELVAQLRARSLAPVATALLATAASVADAEPLDFADVVGQASARRALEVAAAGGHNVAML